MKCPKADAVKSSPLQEAPALQTLSEIQDL
jgi:hypothetical protein